MIATFIRDQYTFPFKSVNLLDNYDCTRVSSHCDKGLQTVCSTSALVIVKKSPAKATSLTLVVCEPNWSLLSSRLMETKAHRDGARTRSRDDRATRYTSFCRSARGRLRGVGSPPFHLGCKGGDPVENPGQEMRSRVTQIPELGSLMKQNA
jgi:hypothetical protein